MAKNNMKAFRDESINQLEEMIGELHAEISTLQDKLDIMKSMKIKLQTRALLEEQMPSIWKKENN